MRSLMEKEIFSEPEVLNRCFNTNLENIAKIASEIKRRNIKTFFTMARGTSDNAATCFSYFAPYKIGCKVGKIHPSLLTIYKSHIDMSDTCVLVISQSGMSKDTIEVLRKNKQSGALIVAITNNEESTVAKEADYHIYLNVDEEKSVAATKTFVSEVLALYMLVSKLADNNFDSALEKVPMYIKNVLEIKDIKNAAKFVSVNNNFILLSRGIMQGCCDELGLKLTECCYLFTKSFSTANFMHGPLSLLDKNANVILIAPSTVNRDEFLQMAKTIKQNDSKLLIFSDDDEILQNADVKIKMPTFPCEAVSSLAYATAVSLLALYTGYEKGLNVDAPRNLNKVTVTL